MAHEFYVPAKGKPDYFQYRASLGDAITFSFDFSAWQEDNSDITSVTWTVEAGSAAVSGASESGGVATALVTLSSAGRSLISVLATTASQKKKIWLEILVKDQAIATDDYGFAS